MSDEKNDIITFSYILKGLENINNETVLPLLKKIEANTAALKKIGTFLAGPGAGHERATVNTRESVSPSAPPSVRAERAQSPAGNKEKVQRQKADKAVVTMAIAAKKAAIPRKRRTSSSPVGFARTQRAAIDDSQTAVVTVEPKRDASGRFTGKQRAQGVKVDESNDNSPKNRGRLATLTAFAVHMTKGGVGDKKGTMREAVGRATLGPMYDAVVEMKSHYDDFKDSKNTLKEKYTKFKGENGTQTATDVKANHDQKSRFLDPEAAKIIEAINNTEDKDEKRHEELVKAILSGGKDPAKETGPGSTMREKARNVLRKKLVPANAKAEKIPGGKRSGGLLDKLNSIPGMAKIPGIGGSAGGGMMGKLGSMVAKVGPLLAAIPLGTIAAGLAAAGAVGSAAYSAVTGKENPISNAVNAAGENVTGKKGWNLGGQVYDTKEAIGNFITGKGKPDVKFQNKYDTEYAGTVKDAASKYGVSEDYMKTTMRIESRGNAGAESSTGAKGLYQFVPGTARQYGIAGKEFDPQANIEAAAKLTADNKKQLEKRGIATSDSNLYMSHQLGVGGFSAALNAAKTGQNPSEIKFGKSTLRDYMDVNGGKGMEVGNFLNMWRTKYADNAVAAGANPNSMLANKGQQPPSVNASPILATKSPENFGISKTAADLANPLSGATAAPAVPTVIARKAEMPLVNAEKPVQVAKLEARQPTGSKSMEAAIADDTTKPVFRNKGEGMFADGSDNAKPVTPQTAFRNKGEGMFVDEKPIATVTAKPAFKNKGEGMFADGSDAAKPQPMTVATALPTASGRFNAPVGGIKGLGAKLMEATGIKGVDAKLIDGAMNFAEPVTALATGSPARPVSQPERMTTAMAKMEELPKQAQGSLQQGGADISGMLTAVLEKLNASVAKMSGKDDSEQSGSPVIRTEFDDTMLTLMAYDRM
jgi:hypothetical protein